MYKTGESWQYAALPLVNVFVPTTYFNGIILPTVRSCHDYSGYKTQPRCLCVFKWAYVVRFYIPSASVSVSAFSFRVFHAPHLTSGASVCPESPVTYSAGNVNQKICGIFSESARLQRSSTPPLKAKRTVGHIPAESSHAYLTMRTR